MKNNVSMLLRAGVAWALAVIAGATGLAQTPPSSKPISAAEALHRQYPPGAPRTPNIILIVADDLGYGDLGCYGQEKIKTPNLDKLAAAGTRFTSFYAGSTVCAPSRCALMTGLHTGHARIRGNDKTSLAPEDATLPQFLQGAGYFNGLVGKWGLGNVGTPGTPGDKGFEEFVGYLDQTHAHDYYSTNLDRFDKEGGLRKAEFAKNAGGAKGTWLPDTLQKAAQNFIRLYRPDPFNQQRPFFLCYAPTIPHANNEAGRATGNGMQVPDAKPYSSEPWPQTEKNKAAMITRLDKFVGEIVGKLREYKQDTNTLILFTSDNGPHKEGGVDPSFFKSSGPLRGVKRDLYEGGIRVPLIAVWPGKIPAGRVSEEPFAFWDLLPTLVEVSGGKAPKNIDGLSYLPTLLGQTQTNRHEYFYWEFHEGGFKQAVRAGEWKGVRLAPGKPLELYFIGKDIGETHDVAAENPQVVERLEKILSTARTDSPEWPIKNPETKTQPRKEADSK